jgi:Ca-activated chloride channel family protein
MSLSFGAPLNLLLMLLVPLLLWAARGKLHAFSSGQRRGAFLLRASLFTCLAVATADPRLGRPDDRLAMVLAVDTSASIQAPNQLSQQEWVRQARALAQPDDQLAVINFGRWSSIAVPDARPSSSSGDPRAVAGQMPPSDATNLADALQLGDSLLPASGRRRLVLLTDGQQNVGRAQDIVPRLAARGIEVSFVQPEAPIVIADVLLRGLEAPGYQRNGETLQADALLESTHSTSATLRLFLDNRQVVEQKIELKPGGQRVPLVVRRSADRATSFPAFHVLRAEVEAADDAVQANNVAEAFTVTKETGRVLLLENRAGEAEQLEEALRNSGLRTEVRPASAIPPSAAPLQIYDSIVMVNVPSTALTLDQQTTLESYVQDYGRGLLVTGGNTSYALGGYANSLLGDLLPVDPTPPARRELGSVALILVIDKSGSMDLYRSDVSKMAMAREAAILATEALNPNDHVGVVAFDSRYQWVVPLTRLSGPPDLAAVKSRIATIQADGGTYIFPALEAAYQAVATVPAKLKHIVLLTDGLSADGDYAGLISRTKPQNITLTTIGVGSDTDTALLTRLALLGDGRYYFTERPQEVPRIVSRETTIVSRNAIVEGLIRPLLTESSPVLADLHGEELPPLNGYVATSARPRAQTVLTSDRGDPILAHWQYGLGRVVAWTSDARSEWAGGWFDSPSARRVWGQAVRWSMPAPTDPSFQLSTVVEGDQVTVRVHAFEADGRFSDRREVSATVTTPAGRALQVPLRQVGPGSYEVVAQAPGPGTYAVQAEESRNGSVARSEVGGFVVTPAAELRTAVANRALLEQLAQVTGGRELTDPNEAFARDGNWLATNWTPLWPWLVGLALVLLPIDIAARRLSLFRPHQSNPGARRS